MTLPDHQDNLRDRTLRILLDREHWDHRYQEAVQADYRFASMHGQNDLLDMDFRYLTDDASVILIVGD